MDHTFPLSSSQKTSQLDLTHPCFFNRVGVLHKILGKIVCIVVIGKEIVTVMTVPNEGLIEIIFKTNIWCPYISLCRVLIIWTSRRWSPLKSL
jgi:hypothetical protein